MYTGKIVQTYRQGQEIDVKVMVNFFWKISRKRDLFAMVVNC